LQSSAEQYGAAGYRYVNLQAYTVNGTVRYAAIWLKQAGRLEHAHAGLSQAEFDSVSDTETLAGYRLVDYSVAVLQGVPQFTGLWVSAPSMTTTYYAVDKVPVANYQAEVTSQLALGRMPYSLDGYEINGVPYLATVWHRDWSDGWAAQHAMTTAQAIDAEAANVAAARYARTFTEYADTSQVRLAAVWRPLSDTTITNGPTGSTSANIAIFSFTSPNDPIAGFECRLDRAGSWLPCAESVTYKNLPLGTHTVFVRARDFYGTPDPTPASRTWTITS
jgi:hypothetical protein